MSMPAIPLRTDAAINGGSSTASGVRAVHWPLTVLPAVMLGVLMLRPIWDFDLFWQLRLGQLMLENGALIAREPFSAPHLGEPMPALSWLAQIIMAATFEALGWTGLRLLDALVWLGGVGAVALAARRRGGSAAGLCAGLVLAFIAAHPFASVRPQSFALLCFGLLLALVRLEWPARRSVPWGALILLLWQNLHPSVSIAAIAMGAMALPGWIGWLRDTSVAPPWLASILAVMSLAAMFATPDGFSLLAISAHNATEARGIGVAEWLPLWSPLNAKFAPLVAIVGIAAGVLLVWRWRRCDPAEVVLLLVLTAMTVLAIRFAVFWAVALVSPISRAMAGAEPDRVRACPWAMLAASLCAVAFAQIITVSPFAAQIPVRAVSALAREGVEGTVFTDNYGGPLIFWGSPQWRVAYDGRFWRYSTEEWDRFRAIQHGRTGLAEIVRLDRPVAFVVSRALNPHLIAQLDKVPAQWRRIYLDEGVAAFVRARHGNINR